MTLRRFGLAFFGALLVLAAVGCRPPATTPTGAVLPEAECLLSPTPLTPADTIRIVLDAYVDLGHAPTPRVYSERILYRHLYQTLVRVDCAGAVQPGLAASWSRGDGGHLWSFSLQPGVRFWDGTPVTAAAVVESWETTGAAERHGLSPESMIVVTYHNH